MVLNSKRVGVDALEGSFLAIIDHLLYCIETSYAVSCMYIYMLCGVNASAFVVTFILVTVPFNILQSAHSTFLQVNNCLPFSSQANSDDPHPVCCSFQTICCLLPFDGG